MTIIKKGFKIKPRFKNKLNILHFTATKTLKDYI